MKILAADDELLQLNKLKRSIEEAIPDAEVTAFSFSAQVMEWLANGGEADIAFLDIEMGSVSGIQVAKRLQAKNPKINIVFVTGYLEYAPEAMNMRASGYVSKPVTAQKIKDEMENLRFPMPKPVTDKKVRVNCFGSFDITVDGKPLKFRREKSKELLAYLIDRRGAICSPREICAILWEEDKMAYFRQITRELSVTLKEADASNIFVKQFKGYGIIPSLIECDYYDYLNDMPYAVKAFHGEYMSQYSWAEVTLASLLGNAW